MSVKTIDAPLLQKMIVSGARLLDERKEVINELNVFPVPDGDTGTNMSLTMLAAAKEVENIEPTSIAAIGKAFATGSLRGARGNSGVILSQLIRGFVKGLGDSETVDAQKLGEAAQLGVETAYKAVMKPKEGTILTVAREVAEKATSLETEDLMVFCEEIIIHGYDILAQTQDMLPVLKEAGVVDAGGQGLMAIIEGAALVMLGEINIDLKRPTGKPSPNTAFSALQQFNTEDITFAYCTEFIVERDLSKPYDEDETRKYLDGIGDSLVAVSDEEYIKIHVHTDNPGHALQHGLKFGSLTNIKIENMKEQHSSILGSDAPATQTEPAKEIGFVSIVAGSGFADIVGSLGVDKVVEGGQTMNPSTEDILDAIKSVNAKKVIVMPNNKNIILAAEQAAELITGCDARVIPTTTIPEGISAMLAYDQSIEDIEEIVEGMTEAMNTVSTAQITIAVRDTIIKGEAITEGEYLGILDGEIVVNNPSLKQTYIELLGKFDKDSEIITIYYGEDIDDETANEYLEEAENIFDEADVDLQFGNQPVYYFMISAE
ncbi:MAG: dihydroxyacetone kinase [Epulopiscium sp. Nele67-Bin004]|nr:MAG: dihydroxyacetone kinase [Epulopiscium sp. Nele67-Bin004]